MYFDQTAFRAIAFWATFLAWFIYVVALLQREQSGQEDDRTSRLLLVCTAGALLLAFAAAYLVPRAALENGFVFWVGLTMTWAGLAVSEWARRSLGRHYHPVVIIDDDHVVVTSGPYRVIRHPIYAGRVLALVGLGLAMSNWLSVVACVALPIYGFSVRIRVEEAAMLNATGAEYAAYRRRTWRLIPWVW